MQIPCQNNSYVNYTHATSCLTCEKGFYCKVLGISTPCPVGHYCPAGSVFPTACPIGTYSDKEKLTSKSDCRPCPQGKYCDQPALTKKGSGDCDDGFYCFSGVDSPRPGFSLNDTCHCGDKNMSLGGICPEGHFCPRGAFNPTPCKEGTYSSTKGSSKCLTCPSGFYCPSGTTSYSQYPCPAGGYCQAGSKTSTPCPEGTFSKLTKLRQQQDCQNCTPGFYCSQPGLTQPSGKCLGGYYCQEESASPKQNECPIGFFCPPGSSSPEPCDPGFYCPSKLLNSSFLPCSAGYFCTGGSSKYKPTNGPFGGPCPEGSYCPPGSSAPLKCPPGTYSDKTHSISLTECQHCPPGSCCPHAGMKEPEKCTEGYYCPGNLSSCEPIEHKCQPGHYCPTNSSYQIVCPSGYYQRNELASACESCPAGYYCDNGNFSSPVTSYELFPCPKGHYCPPLTKKKNEFPCPLGTFNDQTRVEAQENCTLCLPGKVCSMKGLISPDKECHAGFICRSGAFLQSPNDSTVNGRCPQGSFCPKGTEQPKPCPVGSFNPLLQGESIQDCKSCKAGHYCNETGMTSSGPACHEGFICRNGSTSPEEKLCPLGHYCPEGTMTPRKCMEGHYSDKEGIGRADMCKKCKESYYCPDPGQSESIHPCWAGYYCPPGEKNPTKLCTTGFYCPNGTAKPLSCNPGSFTSSEGQYECTTCAAGYYCAPDPQTNTTSIIPCPQGYYCPNGSSSYDKTPCPSGTFNPYFNISIGLRSIHDCTPCRPGYYCEGIALKQPSGPCKVGYFCKSGSKEKTHKICPPGFYCPGNSGVPITCEAGTYSSIEGSSSCHPCESGYVCPAGSTDFSQNKCPPGSFCPKGTAPGLEKLCDDGTYNPNEGSRDLSDCFGCPPGEYCQGKGLNESSGKCFEGYYCTGGSASPLGAGKGGICPKGNYCPSGSIEPIPCPGGYYCDQDGLGKATGICASGHYCKENSTSGNSMVDFI